MKKKNGLLFLVALLGFVVLQQSCKPKKVLVNETATVQRVEEPKKEEPAPVVRETQPTPQTPAVEAPNYNFRNIQFELDSYVLKTESYAILDQISREMKKDANARFTVYGHASIEGSDEYNMRLSIDRANAVKVYLVNSGINANNLVTVGRGSTQPVATNDTESGRALNRRVEVKINR